MAHPEEFAALMEREYRPLVGVAAAILGERAEAEAVVQEAFTRALVRWRRVSNLDRPGAWVRLVTVRLAIRAASKRRRNGVGVRIPEHAHDEAGQLDGTLDAAIAELPVPERAVVVLHYLCDLPVADVAAIVKASPGTVRVRLHRARGRLALALTEGVNDVRSQ